jgi:hypothetical protein
MKKRRLKRVLLAVFGGIVLAIVAAIVVGERPPVRFRFLDGRRLQWRRTPSKTATLYYYSFESDYNDVYAEAAAELSAVGFRERFGPLPWWLRGHIHNYGRSSYFQLRRPTYEVEVVLGEGRDWVDVRMRVAARPASIRERLRHFLDRVMSRQAATGTTALTSPQGPQWLAAVRL